MDERHAAEIAALSARQVLSAQVSIVAVLGKEIAAMEAETKDGLVEKAEAVATAQRQVAAEREAGLQAAAAEEQVALEREAEREAEKEAEREGGATRRTMVRVAGSRKRVHRRAHRIRQQPRP